MDATKGLMHLCAWFVGNLNQFWDCGNAYRIEKGLPAKHLDNWMRSPEVAEYVAVLEREFKCVDSTYFDILPCLKEEDSCFNDTYLITALGSNPP